MAGPSWRKFNILVLENLSKIFMLVWLFSGRCISMHLWISFYDLLMIKQKPPCFAQFNEEPQHTLKVYGHTSIFFCHVDKGEQL